MRGTAGRRRSWTRSASSTRRRPRQVRPRRDHVRPSAIRIVLADDAVLLREALAAALEASGFRVVGQAEDVPGLLALVAGERPDVAIVDVRMPPTHTTEGLEAARQIRQTQPEVAILVLSQYIETRYAIDLIREDPAGIGYLLKERVTRLDDLADAVRRVAAGGVRDRPGGRGAPARPPAQPLAARRADAARARDPRADGRGPVERRDRAAAHARAQDRRGPRPGGLLEAGTRAGGRGPSAGARRACLPCGTPDQPPRRRSRYPLPLRDRTREAPAR